MIILNFEETGKRNKFRLLLNISENGVYQKRVNKREINETVNGGTMYSFYFNIPNKDKNYIQNISNYI